MVDWRATAYRVRHSFSARPDSHQTPPYNYSQNPQPQSHHHHQHPQPQSQSRYHPHHQSVSQVDAITATTTIPAHSNPHQDRSVEVIQSYTHASTAHSSHSHAATLSVPSLDAASTGSSMSRVPGAFYIPNSIAHRASLNMPPEDGAALRRQLAFDALALVRELPCYAQGWMLVKRDGSKLSSLFRSTWIHFWTELRGGMLLFYDPQHEDDEQSKYNRMNNIAQQHHHQHYNKCQVKLVFTATDCIIDLKNTATYSQLKIRRSDGQSIILRVPDHSPKEAQQWVVALQAYTFQYITIRLADLDWIEPIGKGASGKVFLVRDNRTNARLALKVIDKSRVFRAHLTFQHVVNERLVLELCSGCPFVIQLRYAFQTDSHLYFATDFYDGGDVFSLLQSHHGRLNEQHAKRIIAEIVLALCWLHERNIVYRDLKPENVVLDGDGHVRLADFGLAKVLKCDTNFLTQTICGTTAYAAPEMLQSKPYSVALDLWCLGVFIYHILCGRTPYNLKGLSLEEMEEVQRTRHVRYPTSLSLEAESLIKGLLQTDPMKRTPLEDVKRHPFFRGIDWVHIARKEPHPDDVSQFVADKEHRDSVVRQLAIERAQQFGGFDAATAELRPERYGGRVDAQEISSMTLDRYLLRNINREEWRHVSFSDDDDVSATAEFPAVVHKKGMEKETWAIAGWAWTCSELSGHSLTPSPVPTTTSAPITAPATGNTTNTITAVGTNVGSSIGVATTNATTNATTATTSGSLNLSIPNYPNATTTTTTVTPTPTTTTSDGATVAALAAATATASLSPIARRSLPVVNEDKVDASSIQRASITGDVTRIASAHNGSTTGSPSPSNPNAPSSHHERLSRPIDHDQHHHPYKHPPPAPPSQYQHQQQQHQQQQQTSEIIGHFQQQPPPPPPPPPPQYDTGFTTRPSLDVRARARRSVDALRSDSRRAATGGGGGGAKGVFNFGRITSSVRDARQRASLDNSGRGRRSVDRRSRGPDVVGGRQGPGRLLSSVPRPVERRHIKSSLDFGLGRSKGT